MKIALIWSACFLGSLVCLSADAPRVPQVRLPLMKTAPVIDGTVNDDEWSGAARMERFAWAGVLSPQEASFWVGCDGKELFIAVVSETPPSGKILARVRPMPEEGDARTWMDDSIELVLDPLPQDRSGRRRLYHANLNSLGAINDTAYIPGGSGEAWRGRWRTASKIIGDRWHFEVALPLADMKVADADLAQPFGVRICRNWHQYTVGAAQTEWGAVLGGFLQPETIPLVTWDTRAPVVQVVQLSDPGKVNFHPRVAIHNPHAEPLEVRVVLQCKPKNSAPSNREQPVKLAPNAVETVELLGAASKGEEAFGSIQVTSLDGSAVYYLREFHWKVERPDPMWATDADAVKKVEVNFAYFPYHDTIKAMVSFHALDEKEKVRGVKLSVRRQFAVPPSGGTNATPTKVGTPNAKPIATTHVTDLKKYSVQKEWRIPRLKEGSYQFVVELEGVKVDPILTDFVRHILPWEHNTLGKSDVVIPPFEPIRVQGQQVSTILRAHTLNDLGLFDQIESLGKSLLKAPMRLEVNGVAATVKRLGFSLKTKTRVVTESKWSAGKLAGSARGEWDYDGMMKWTLDIQPSNEAVESMTLVIPLDDRLMPLMHTCTDGIRFNYAGATPAGPGRVWDGSKAARNSLIGSYVPYIWLGAEERGLAVFGENDKGWGRDPKVPCQELVRNGDTLELRLNLIAAPTKIEQPRRIVIGFQATPVKPMPEGWRTWTQSGGGHPDVQVNIAWSGSCYSFGTVGPCYEIYPRHGDFSLYEKYAETRRTGVVDKEFIERWMAGYPPADEDAKRNQRPSIEGTFRFLAGKPDGVRSRFLQYTNARGVSFDTREGRTFVDEWHRDAFPNRRGVVWYDVDPVESFRDYAMWYYKKMFETWLDDLYWDCVFPQANFDTVGPDAYELPDGTIQPSCGLFNMRELIKRTAVLQHELGKRGFNQPHMTNTEIVPVLSFAGTQLSWEDRAGDADFQDRFSREYIRAESTGRQSGNVPFLLTLISGPDEQKNRWAARTCAGVTLTHEIKPQTPHYYCLDYWSNFQRLLEFGYGKAETRVWNYWDENYPLRIEGSDTSSLIVSKPGSAIVVVCDWAKGGDIRMKLDPSLGLGAQFTATDMESNQPLAIGADGTISFALQKHDFKMVLVRAE
jgi:hypothetical protein